MQHGLFLLTAVNSVFQEDISKLRRKIEKAKKPAEKISNGDDILNEEINDYKVGFCVTKWTGNCFHLSCFKDVIVLNQLQNSIVDTVQCTSS